MLKAIGIGLVLGGAVLAVLLYVAHLVPLICRLQEVAAAQESKRVCQDYLDHKEARWWITVDCGYGDCTSVLQKGLDVAADNGGIDVHLEGHGLARINGSVYSASTLVIGESALVHQEPARARAR